MGEARRDCFSQCNAGADVVEAHMWCVYWGKQGMITFCNVMLAEMCSGNGRAHS